MSAPLITAVDRADLEALVRAHRPRRLTVMLEDGRVGDVVGVTDEGANVNALSGPEIGIEELFVPYRNLIGLGKSALAAGLAGVETAYERPTEARSMKGEEKTLGFLAQALESRGVES